MEIVLYVANTAGVAFILFGFGLMAGDGRLAIAGYAVTAATAGTALYYTL